METKGVANMKKNSTGFIVGLIFILAGLGYAAKAMEWLPDFTIFFDGWWTLFIIIPSFFGLFKEEDNKKACIVGLVVGFLFLLAAQDVFKWSMFMPLLLAGLCVLIGVKLIFPNKEQKKISEYQTGREDGIHIQRSPEPTHAAGKITYTAILASHDIRVDNQEFTGADLNAILGGISLNLKNAIVRENVVIHACTILGGIDILLPSPVKVVVECTPILGGVENHVISPLGADENTPTIFIKATCVLGGIDIK